MHIKDFDKWNEKKKKIEEREILYFEQRQIWWCNLGVNIGNEQDGKGENAQRPVLIIKKYNTEQALIVPLSTQIKTHPLRYIFTFKGIEQNALLSQVKVISSKRLVRKMGKLPSNIFTELKSRLKNSF
jgi:mRNA interferase MazF